MAKRPRYTDKFRADCVLMLETEGYPDKEGALTIVSNATGIPLATLHRWYHKSSNPPPSDIVNEKRFDLIDAIMGELEKAFGAMDGARGNASYRDLATAIGILADKKQLLQGKATSIVEIMDKFKDGTLNQDDIPALQTLGIDVPLPGIEA